MSVEELLSSSGRPVVIISNDGDFGNTTIHDDFVGKLKDQKIDPGRVSLCKSIGEFNDKYLKDIYDLMEVKEFFKSGKELSQFHFKNHTLIEDTLSKENPAHHEIDLDFRIEEPSFDSVGLYDDFSINRIDQIGPNSFAIEFSVSGNAEIEFVIPKSDVYYLDGKYDLGEERNEWYQEAFSNRDIYINGTLIINKEATEIISIEVSISSELKGGA